MPRTKMTNPRGQSGRRLAAPRLGQREVSDPNFSLYLLRERQNFRRLLRQRQFNQADIRWRKYQCASGVDHHTVNGGTEEDPCAKLVTSTVGRTTFKPGSTVLTASNAGDRHQVIIGLPPPGQRGTAEFPFLQQTTGLPGLAIISADPDVIGSGTATSSTITGYGFQSVDIFECVVYNETTLEFDPDPYVTVTDQTYVDDTTWTVEFTADANTPVGYKVTVKVSRP